MTWPSSRWSSGGARIRVVRERAGGGVAVPRVEEPRR